MAGSLRHFIPFLALAGLFFFSQAQAQDLNGYVSEYECKSGGPQCDVDVVSLGQCTPCDETITTADSESVMNTKINGGGNCICIEPGDYTSRDINFTTDGTSNDYHVFRYSRSGDTDDDPWDQSSPNQVLMRNVDFINSDYWLFHRIRMDLIDGSPGIAVNPGTNLIFNRIYSDEGGAAESSQLLAILDANSEYVTLQNSLWRNQGPEGPGQEAVAADIRRGNFHRLVNNECKDWVSHCVQVGGNCAGSCSTFTDRRLMNGIILENNDFYYTPALYTDCNGNYSPSGPPVCGASESVVSIKHRSEQATPSRYIHNRVWGVRVYDSNVCCTGTPGHVMGTNEWARYMLFQNNILADSQMGGLNIAGWASQVGNIYFDILNYHNNEESRGISIDEDETNYEIYANTFIRVAPEDTEVVGKGSWVLPWMRGGNIDVKCNTFIDTTTKRDPGQEASSSVADYNAFYDAESFTFNGTNTNVIKTVATRANSTSYSPQDVVRWGTQADCAATTDPECFLYMADISGAQTSASSPPTPCVSANCVFSDGGVTWRAIRGPHLYYRKLITAQEQKIIPYATPYQNALESTTCPISFANTNNLGVDDTTP